MNILNRRMDVVKVKNFDNLKMKPQGSKQLFSMNILTLKLIVKKSEGVTTVKLVPRDKIVCLLKR